MGERERQRECFESIDSEIVCERESGGEESV